jgi:hypothetical protein
MTGRHLYSIFLEYRGGTYISQIESASPFDALQEWATSLPEEELMQWSLKREALLATIRDGSLVPLGQRVNVWCLSGVDDEDQQLLLNVISTAKP